MRNDEKTNKTTKIITANKEGRASRKAEKEGGFENKGTGNGRKLAGILGMLWLVAISVIVLYARWNTVSKSEKYTDTVEKGKTYMAQGMYVEAKSEFENAELMHPDSNVQTGIALCSLALEDYVSFKNEADEIQASYGLNESLYAALAYYYSKMGDECGMINILAEGVKACTDSTKLKEMYDKYKGKYTDSGTEADDVQGQISDWNIISDSKGVRVLNANLGTVGDGIYDKVYDISADSCIGESWPETSVIISAVVDGTAGYYDENGYKRKAPEGDCSYLGAPRDGYALVCTSGKWGFVDMNFEPVGEWYEDATSFANGMAAVKKNGKWAFVDTDFNQITGYDYEDVAVDQSRRCSVAGVAFALKNGTYTAVDINGEKGDFEKFDSVDTFAEKDGYAACRKDGKWYMVSAAGEKSEVKCDDLTASVNGIAAFKSDGKWGYTDAEDGKYTNAEFEEAQPVNSHGYAAVKRNGKWEFIHFTRFSEFDSAF